MCSEVFPAGTDYVFLSTAETQMLLLEETKIDPNAKNNDGDTPLHLAYRSGNTKTVQLLVRDPRCNPLEKNSSGDTALHVACRLKFTGEADIAHTFLDQLHVLYTLHCVCLWLCCGIMGVP